MRVRESQRKNLIITVLLSELKSTRFTTVYALVEDHYKYARKSSWCTVARGSYLQTATTLLFAPCILIIKGLLTLTPCKSHHHQWHASHNQNAAELDSCSLWQLFKFLCFVETGLNPSGHVSCGFNIGVASIRLTLCKTQLSFVIWSCIAL